MKDKHINIESDSALLKLIYAEVERKLKINNKATGATLLVKLIVYFSLLIICFCNILYVQNIAGFIISYTGFGIISVLLGFNFAHDCSHNTIFKTKKLNNFCFVFIYTLLGAHAAAWKFRHIHSHHYAPNVKDYDSDLQIATFIRVEPDGGYKWFHKYQHWYAPFVYTLYSLYWIFIKDFIIYYNDPSYPKRKTAVYHLIFWVQKTAYICYLVIVPLMLSNQQWYTVITAFTLMHLIQSLFLLFTFFITHHVENTQYFNTTLEGYIKTSWINNQVKSSNDFFPFSQAANFIFGGFNTHIAHHLFPHINHVHYPKLNKILYRTLRAHQIEPNATGFFSGILSHLKHLKAMGKNPCSIKGKQSRALPGLQQ